MIRFLSKRPTYEVSAFGGRLLSVGALRFDVAVQAVEFSTGKPLAPSKMSISPPLGQWCSWIRIEISFVYRLKTGFASRARASTHGSRPVCGPLNAVRLSALLFSGKHQLFTYRATADRHVLQIQNIYSLNQGSAMSFADSAG